MLDRMLSHRDSRSIYIDMCRRTRRDAQTAAMPVSPFQRDVAKPLLTPMVDGLRGS